MIGFPASFERTKHENIAVAATLASEIATIIKHLESAVKNALRKGLAEAKLVYIEGEYGKFVSGGVEVALTVAAQGKSQNEIAAAIEENISAAIDAGLKRLNAPS